MELLEVIRSMERGGAQRLLVDRLRRAEGSEHRSVVVNTRPSGNALEAELPPAQTLIRLRWRDPAQLVGSIRRIARAARSDLIVVHSPSDAVWLKLARAVGLIPVPVVEVVHNTRYRRRSVEIAARLTSRWADRTLAVSEGARRSRMLRHARAVRLVHGGVDGVGMLERLDADADWIARERARLVDGVEQARLIVYCGRLVAEKRLDDVVRALALLGDPRLLLVVVGDGPMGPEYRRLVAEQGLADAVRFVGEVPDGWRYTALGDVFCLTSAHEGLPVALIEAVLLGRPVIGTTIPGVTEIIEDGVNGLLVRPADPPAVAAAILRLVDGPALPGLLDRDAVAANHWNASRSDERFYSALVE